MNGTAEPPAREFPSLLDTALLLRLGLGLTFLYAAIAMLTNPTAWVGFIPHWVGALVNPMVFLEIHSVFELLLGAALVAGMKVRWMAALAALDLLALLVFYGVDDITFRDMGLLLAAVALFVIASANHKK